METIANTIAACFIAALLLSGIALYAVKKALHQAGKNGR